MDSQIKYQIFIRTNIYLQAIQLNTFERNKSRKFVEINYTEAQETKNMCNYKQILVQENTSHIVTVLNSVLY